MSPLKNLINGVLYINPGIFSWVLLSNLANLMGGDMIHWNQNKRRKSLIPSKNMLKNSEAVPNTSRKRRIGYKLKRSILIVR